jgi:pimeloyl-ACP methyl ester carboxylesterase
MAVLSSIKECEIATAAGRISYLEAGEGPVLLLLHGIGSGARSWRAQLMALSDKCRVIAWNAPGYDASTAFVTDAPGVQDYAEAIRDFLDTLGISRCDIVGHSLGALIAARFACAFPDYVRSLTLAGCAIGHARLEAAERERLLKSRIGDVEELGPHGMAEKRGPRLVTAAATDEIRRQVIDTMAAVDPRGYAQASRMLSGGDMLGDLATLSSALPLQFIYGSADVITPPEVNLRAAAICSHAPVHVIEAAGHALYVEKAGEFNLLMRSFIGGIDGPR